jgi:hypothetical protein
VIDVEEGLAGVLYVDPVLGPVVLLESLEALAREGGGGVQVGAQLSHIEILRLVLIRKHTVNFSEYLRIFGQFEEQSTEINMKKGTRKLGRGG